jgi:iron complex transport system ATP-binding protein
MRHAMLELRNVSYRWPGGSHGLGPISHSVAPGQLVALIGPNGAGKSTLLKIIAALWHPDGGEVLVNQKNVLSLTAAQRARHLAFVPQTLDTGFDLTVREVVELGGLNRLSWRDRLQFHSGISQTRLESMLRQTEIWHLKERTFTTLSGGEAKRTLLAAALMQEAPLLLLDEPTAHLDPGHAMKFLDLVRAKVDTGELTVLMAYHDLTTVGLYADELWVIDKGQLVLTGTPADVLPHALIRQIYDVDLIPLTHPRTHRPMLIFP